ncbi:MAG: maleylpyruvate isomerase family mycothiol-dependent enzyme [Actinobacteria bacterium]|nr:maleylpyruvate isomerase family mycothiol-dependent enzyme [Actinomycetota bacterium]
MQLTPRYDAPPVARFVDPPTDLAVPLGRQRRRLGHLLDGLDADQWATPSRCEGWTVRDVIAHLVGADRFWAVSARAGLAGEPTRYLVGFDPVATPAAMVAGTSEQAPAEVLADYHRACDDLLDALADLEPEQWQLIAEGPPGHLQMQGIVRHALWDGWIHERDVALPLGVTPDQEADELAAVLEYAIALGPGLQATLGSERTGTLAAVADELDDAVVVEIGPTVTIGRRPTPDGTPTLRGGAVDLIEGLSLRAPFAPDLADEDRWMVEGLAVAFDQAPPT